MNLEKKFEETLKKIKISKSEKILVALSGGKDSAVVAYLLKKGGYNIEGLHIDLGMGKYSEDCLKKIQELCRNLKIKLWVFEVKKEFGNSMCYIRSKIQAEKKGIKNCAICGVIKKRILNKEARKLEVSKIATGHNLDDEAQTFLINIFKGSPELSSNSGAITQNKKDKKFITRIKPLFYIAEKEVKAYAMKMKLPVNYEKCPCAIDSYRIQIRNFLEKEKTRSKENIIHCLEKLKNKVNELKSLEKVFYCENCGEPSRKNICKSCELMS